MACYRRDDAIDPEMYAAAIAATLADFPRAVVDYVTDPRTGIASRLKFLPTVAEVREDCDRQRASMWKRRNCVDRKPIPVPPRDYSTPGRRANVFVHADAPQYERCRKLSETADPADWENDARPGIWVALGLFQGFPA